MENQALTRADVLVIGAGASGLAAGIFAASSGKNTVILEKSALPARKVSASGNGRCNITNRFVSKEKYHGASDFAVAVGNTFPFDRVLEMFSRNGVESVEEEEGRFFPRCGRARAVSDTLLFMFEEAGGRLTLSMEALAVRRHEGGFEVALSGGRKIYCRRLVLACGGMGYPQLGGAPSGYRLAESLGHSLVPPSPALVPLCVKEAGVKRLKGIRANCSVSVMAGGKTECVSSGELLFTDYGISGPCALNASRQAVSLLSKGRVFAHINLFPEMTPSGFRTYIDGRFSTLGRRTVKHFFTGLVHESIGNLILDIYGLQKDAPASSLSASDRERVCSFLTAWKIELTGSLSWKEAMATAGGIDAGEINPETMESLKCPGLFLTGEMIDVDGDTGGFNLQFAWSSGRLAGLSV